jgi:hypothetical protein
LAEARGAMAAAAARAWTPVRGAVRAAGRAWIPVRDAIRALPAVAQAWIQDERVVAAASEAEARAWIQGEGLTAVACAARVRAVTAALVVVALVAIPALAAIPVRAGIPGRVLLPERAGRVADGLQVPVRVEAQPQGQDDRPPVEAWATARDGNPRLVKRERNAHRSRDGSRRPFAGGRGSHWQTERDSASPPVRWNAGRARARCGARCGPQPARASGDNSIRRGRR